MKLSFPQSSKRGFTLIELIIVIAIIAIIVAAVFVAIDPVRRLNTSRNSTRRTDVTAIVQALQLYTTDTLAAGNSLAGGVATLNSNANNWYRLGSANCTAACGPTGNTVTVTNCVDVSGQLVPNYIKAVPFDKAGGSATDTRYAVRLTSGAYEAKACNPQAEGAGGSGTPPDITISR